MALPCLTGYHWWNAMGLVKSLTALLNRGALFQILDLFGYVCETNYGRNFDVRTEVNSTNLVCTGMGLHAETDNPYCNLIPTVRFLYCPESAASGDYMVVDWFAAALRLCKKNEEYFDVLASYSARF